MKQLDLFKNCTEPPAHIKKDTDKWILYIDGAARNNPGQAGAGFCLQKNDLIIKKNSFYLGIKTNNQAEYLGLLLGIFYAKKLLQPHDMLYIMSDSELLTKQLRKEYKVRDRILGQMYQLACLLLAETNYSICHIDREYNTEADALANEGIDKKKAIPHDFIQLLMSHEISL